MAMLFSTPAPRGTCATLLLAAASLAPGLPGHAANPPADAPAAAQANGKAAKGSKRRQPGQRVRAPAQRSSSEETPEQRDRRLYRECQGRHNAGACAGYTQPPPGKRQR